MNKKFKLSILTLIVLGITSISSFIAFGYNSVLNKKTPQNVIVSEKAIKRNNEAIDVNLKIPVVNGIKNKSIENEINNMFYKDAVNFANPLEKEAKKYLADTKKDKNLHFNKYSAYTTYKSKYNKNNILSIPVRYSQYTGGANGLEVQRGYTFNLKNGKLLSLSDLFDKSFDYKKVISTSVLNQMKANKDMYFPDAITGFKEINGTQPYYLEDGYLVIFYGPFEIAPHSSGIPEFKIPFSSLKFTNTLGIK
jgi:hypothetical protein